MSVTFYDCATAPSPRRARILLAEKQIDVDTVQIDLMNGEHLGEAFRKVNPNCTVPALRLESGTVLTENNAIAAWADAVKAEIPMLGSTPEEKGLVANWNSRIELEGLMAIAEALRNSSPRMKGRATTGPVNYEQIPALAERGMKRIARFMDTLNDQLEGRDFVAIDGFSWADISALVVVDFAAWIKVVPGDQHTNIKRWHEAVAARPSAKL